MYLRVTQEQAEDAFDVCLGSILTEVRAKGNGKSRQAATIPHRKAKIKNKGKITVIEQKEKPGR